MKRKRVRLIIEVDIDPIPGGCDSAEWWLEHVRYEWQSSCPWYHPTVELAPEQPQ